MTVDVHKISDKLNKTGYTNRVVASRPGSIHFVGMIPDFNMTEKDYYGKLGDVYKKALRHAQRGFKKH